MAGDTFLDVVSGVHTQKRGTQTSAGAGNAGDVVALGDDGYLDPTLFPAGIGPDVFIVQASENLAIGDYVNIHNVTGDFRVRKADASAVGKQAHGYVKAAVTSGSPATVYSRDLNTNQSSLTAGDVYLSPTVAGRATNTAPTGSGQVVQRLGVAVAATTVDTDIDKTYVVLVS